jgi:hypothetical protein
MLGSVIIELIQRRRDQFRERCCQAVQGGEVERNRSIAEEYDSLIAEIEGVAHSQHGAHHRIVPTPKYMDDPSEQWILGDQGQSGG